MTRLPSIVFSVTAACALAACLSSCGEKEKPSETNNTVASNTDQSVDPPEPIFSGWKTPQAVICLTGETHGYLEPCGCSETQSGGLSRRADLFRQIDERGWPRTALDLGGVLKRNRRQSQIKFEALRDGLKQINYAAIALGNEELRLGAEYLLSQEADDQVPLIGSNIDLFGMEDFTMPQRSLLIEVGGLKIGVVSVMGTSLQETIPDITTRDPKLAITKQLEEFEKGAGQSPNLLVLLSHAEVEESKDLAKAFPQFDLIVSAGGPEDPRGIPEDLDDSQTLLVTVGHKGKHIGVVGYFPEETPKLRFELIELDNQRFGETPAMQEIMRQYQERLLEEHVASSMQRIPYETDATFVGAKTCGECHTKSYSKWKTTKHAQAYNSLSKGREGQEKDWISRVHDPECLCCHVTGWDSQNVFPYESGFVDAQSTPHLQGQQCENCHGPGSIHTDLELQRKAGTLNPQDEKLISWRRELHLNQEIAEKQLCNKCHDLDNSPKFDFQKYWKEVAHPGRD